MARALTLLALALTLSACERDPLASSPAASASVTANEPSIPAARFDVSGETAFELLTTPDGAWLAFARHSAKGARIEVAMLDASGAPQGKARTIATLEPSSSVGEITAASSAGVVAIAWLERKKTSAVIRAVLADGKLGSFAEPSMVASATSGGDARRGNLVLAGDRERLMAFFRGEPEPCIGNPERQCTRVGFSELAGQTPRPARIPLSVPAPCGSAIAGFVLSANRWTYAVCSVETGRERTTVFRIQYDPRYAEAHEVLAGCTPSGAVSLAQDDVVVAADCNDGRRAVRVGTMNTPPQPLDLSQLDIVCERGHPVLNAPRFELRLDAPRDGLAALLPAKIAPAGSRAVWTGTTLLVARYLSGQVAVQRFGCRGGDWTRLAG